MKHSRSVSLVSPFPGNFYNSFVARFDSSGNCIGAIRADNVQANEMEVDNNSNVYLTGGFSNTAHFGNITLTTNNSSDIFLANLNAITGMGEGERVIKDQLIIYANPNKGSFRIKVPDDISSFEEATLLVFDQQGREIIRFTLSLEEDETSVFDVDKAGPGIYMVQLVQGAKSYWGKLVVE